MTLCAKYLRFLFGFQIFVCFVFFVSLSPIIISCGSKNSYSTYAPKDLEAQAELDMEGKRYSDAQEKLATVLSEAPENYDARSLYAASFAGQAGITLFDILMKAVNEQKSGTANQLDLLKGLVGDATAENVALMKSATDNMLLIPTAAETPSMKYQAGIFQALYGILLIKKLQQDLATLGTIDPADAQALLDALLAAKGSFGTTSGPVDSAVGKIVDDIQAKGGVATYIQSLPK